MPLYEAGSFCDGASGECHSSQVPERVKCHKPIEIYAFIDPSNPDCWALEPMIKKLTIEYGQYFKLRYFVGGNLNTLNTFSPKEREKTAQEQAERWEMISRRYGMPCNGDIWYEKPISSTYDAAIAFKAAELQGKQAGLKFLRKLREAFFLKKKNITDEDILIQCADEAGLDVNEFRRDIHASEAVKAFQCDMQTTSEMEVDHLPTLVFLNANAEDAGIKITGNYPYEAYEQAICELLGCQPQTSEPPTIENFMKKYSFVATKEIAVVYDLSCDEVERKMKKLLLKQQVERIPVKYGTCWQYRGRDIEAKSQT